MVVKGCCARSPAPRHSIANIHTKIHLEKYINNKTNQAFGSVFGKAYDAVIKPFKPVADALGPAISAAVSFLESIKCPADW